MKLNIKIFKRLDYIVNISVFNALLLLQAEKEFLVQLLPPPFWVGSVSYMKHLTRKGGGDLQVNRTMQHRYAHNRAK
jgi:hypothetical protein